MTGPKRWLESEKRSWLCVLVALPLVWLGVPDNAAAADTLTDGNTTISLNLPSSSQLTSWTVDGLTPTPVTQEFFFRVGATGPEADLSHIGTVTVTPNSNGRQLSALFANTQYGVQINYSLGGGSAGSGTSGLTESVRVYNYGSTTLDFHLFDYMGFNAPGSVTFGSSPLVIVTTELEHLGTFAFGVTGLGSPNRWQAATGNTLLGSLTDANPTTLDGSNPGGSGDVAWALEWDYTIGAGTSKVISSIDNLQVPEPSAAALVVLALGAWAFRRQQQKQTKTQ
jgi:hypothetical protein